MIERYFTRSPYLTFLPFALLYAAVVMVRGSEVVYGDEERYLKLAENLCHGFYSPPPPNINLWSGPGYPIIIAPLVYFGASQLWMTVLNVIFQYLSVVFLFKALRLKFDLRISAALSIVWGLMYNAWLWEMPLVATEPLTCLLCSLIAFSLIQSLSHPLKKQRTGYLLLTGFLVGYLVLTKIIFGYVLLAALVACLLFWSLKRTNLRRCLLQITACALLVNLPYLIYTHGLTQRWFYWGNSGGLSLYWMSTPHDGETGDWHGLELYQPAQRNSDIALRHQKDFDYLSQFTGVALDDELKKMALQNIREHPGKYAENCMYNTCRLLFDAPYYFASPTKLYVIRILPMIFFLPFLVMALWTLFRNFKSLPGYLRFLLLLLGLYFCFTILVSAYHRQFYVMIPWMMVLIAWAWSQPRASVQINQGL